MSTYEIVEWVNAHPDLQWTPWAYDKQLGIFVLTTGPYGSSVHNLIFRAPSYVRMLNRTLQPGARFELICDQACTDQDAGERALTDGGRISGVSVSIRNGAASYCIWCEGVELVITEDA